MNIEETLRQLYTSGQINHVDDCRVAIEAVLKSGIKADAFFQYETITHIQVKNENLPEDFRLKDINILILEP